MLRRVIGKSSVRDVKTLLRTLLHPQMCQYYSTTDTTSNPSQDKNLVNNVQQSYGTPDTSLADSSSSESSSSDSSSSDSSDSDSESSKSKSERSTYVEEEIAKFRGMADSWWDPHGDCKPLHSLNTLRVAMIRKGLVDSKVADPESIAGPKPLSGLKILDVGCGGGILCEPLARLGATVVGLDAAEENISIARLHAAQDPRVQANVRYVSGTIEEHAETLQGQYDAVVASEVLEHVNAVDLFIDTCANIIKPGGSFFLTTINKTSCSWVGAIAIAEYALQLLPVGTHDWNKFIPRQDLLFMLERSGVVPRMIHGMAYNPISNDWFWLANTTVNYAVHGIKDLHQHK